MNTKTNEGFESHGFKSILYGALIFGLIFGLSGGVSACLTPDGGVTLYGSAPGCVNGTLLWHTGGGVYLPDGNPTCGGGFFACIDIGKVNDSVIDCLDSTNPAFDLNGGGVDNSGIVDNSGMADNMTVKNCNIHGFVNSVNIYSGIGVNLGGGSNHQIINNTIHHNWKHGIQFNSYYGGITDSVIMGNNIYQNGNAGVYLWNTSIDNLIVNNFIHNNHIGILSNNTGGSTINSNIVCDNIFLDFNSSDWLSISGDNNTCSKPDGWNDSGTTGCTHSCPKHDVPVSPLVPLGVIGIITAIAVARIRK